MTTPLSPTSSILSQTIPCYPLGRLGTFAYVDCAENSSLQSSSISSTSNLE